MKLNFGAEGGKLPRSKTPEYNPRKLKEELGEHDPHANPLEGEYNVPGADVVDPETYYNVPVFEDKEAYNSDSVEVSSRDGEIGEMMNKYGLEEFELKDWMKKCEDYMNGRVKVAPFKDKDQIREFASLYRDYLAATNESGLPFSHEELVNLSDQEQEKLAELYDHKIFLTVKIAEENNTEVAPDESAVIYTTAEKAAPGVRGRYEKELASVINQIAKLEKKISYSEPVAQKKPAPEKAVKKIKDNPAWKNEVPKYSKEELALQNTCLAYFRDRKNAPRPVFVDGTPLNEAQLLEVVKEAAANENWPNGIFKENMYNGHRQLIFTEYSKDRKSGETKTLRYTFLSETCPAGNYFFEADPAKFFSSKKNKNFAIAPIALMVPRQNPKDYLAEKRANWEKTQRKNKEVA